MGTQIINNKPKKENDDNIKQKILNYLEDLKSQKVEAMKVFELNLDKSNPVVQAEEMILKNKIWQIQEISQVIKLL